MPDSTRTSECDGPAPLRTAAQRMSGLELLHAIAHGERPAPPMMRTLGIQPVRVEEGRAIVSQ